MGKEIKGSRAPECSDSTVWILSWLSHIVLHRVPREKLKTYSNKVESVVSFKKEKDEPFILLPGTMKDLNYYKSVYICGMKLKEIKTRS